MGSEVPWRLKHVLFCLVFILVFSLDMFSDLDSICEESTFFFYLTFEIMKTWPNAWLNCPEFLKSLPKDKCDNLGGKAWASRVAQWSGIHLQCRSRRRHRFDPWVGKILWRSQWQANPSSILSQETPWPEKPGRLQSMGSQRAGPEWALTRLAEPSLPDCVIEACGQASSLQPQTKQNRTSLMLITC